MRQCVNKGSHVGRDTQLERSLDSESREKTPQETAGSVSWAIGPGEAVYTVVRKWGF